MTDNRLLRDKKQLEAHHKIALGLIEDSKQDPGTYTDSIPRRTLNNLLDNRERVLTNEV